MRISDWSSDVCSSDLREIARMLGLYADRYVGFTVKHFHDQLVKRHDYVLGYTVTKVHLQRAGPVRVAPKRSAPRKTRPRRRSAGPRVWTECDRTCRLRWSA